MMDARRRSRGWPSAIRGTPPRGAFALKQMGSANDEEPDDSIGTDSALGPRERPSPFGADRRIVTRAAGAAGADRQLRSTRDPARDGEDRCGVGRARRGTADP